MQLFPVLRRRGAAWDASRSLEAQAGWDAHASFMNALADERFVLLGGPLENTPDTLLVVRARTREEIAIRLAQDPWTANSLLVVTRIDPWTLRLGSLA